MFSWQLAWCWLCASLLEVARADGRERFMNCYQGQEDGQVLSLNVGVLIDAPLLQILGGNSEVAQRKLSTVFFMANSILVEQFNMTAVPQKVVIADERSKSVYTKHTEAWMYDTVSNTGHCPHEIDSRLKLFKQSTPTLGRAGMWVLFTGCAFTSVSSATRNSRNHLGLAMKDSICTSEAALIVSYTALNPKIVTEVRHTFLHELGHTMGGRHPFEILDENNKTKYPSGEWGLMDYGDGIWDNKLQFHPLHGKEMCKLLNSRICGPNRKLNCTLLDYNPTLQKCWLQSKCPKECKAAMIGDGVCHKTCNIAACNFDNGDCGCSPGCIPSMEGDGICHEECNTASCSADFGDCACANLVKTTECHKKEACVSQCFSTVLPALVEYYCAEIFMIFALLSCTCVVSVVFRLGRKSAPTSSPPHDEADRKSMSEKRRSSVSFFKRCAWSATSSRPIPRKQKDCVQDSDVHKPLDTPSAPSLSTSVLTSEQTEARKSLQPLCGPQQSERAASKKRSRKKRDEIKEHHGANSASVSQLTDFEGASAAAQTDGWVGAASLATRHNNDSGIEIDEITSVPSKPSAKSRRRTVPQKRT